MRFRPSTGGSRRERRLVLVGSLAAMTGAAVWCSVSALNEPPWKWAFFVGLTMAFFVARLLSTQLPQGDEVCVTLVVGVYGLWLSGPILSMAAALSAGVLDTVARHSQPSSLESSSTRMLDVLRATLVIGLASPWRTMLALLVRPEAAGDTIVVLAALTGLAYAAIDTLTIAAYEWAGDGASLLGSAQGLLRLLGTVYVVHIAMAGVAVHLSAMSVRWAFPVAMLLTLILQNSFNLYMRIRRGYIETVGALAHAAELDRPQDCGHSRRVADLAVVTGRKLGMRGHQLERVGYAALLREIGRMGAHNYDDEVEYLRRGVSIVQAIPFLADVAPLISVEQTNPAAWQELGAEVIRLCSRFDRIRVDVGTSNAVAILEEQARGSRDGDVVSALRDAVAVRNGTVGLP